MGSSHHTGGEISDQGFDFGSDVRHRPVSIAHLCVAYRGNSRAGWGKGTAI
jgi:hypothetical protein